METVSCPPAAYFVLCSRVMLEDVSAQEADAETVRPQSPPQQLPKDGDSSGPTRPMSDSESSSAFGRFSKVRRSLYELCLALLADGQNVELSAECSERYSTECSTESSAEEAGDTAGSGQGNLSGATAGVYGPTLSGIGGRAKRLLQGDEWAVKEFRRVGEGVKPVQVLCRVRLSSFVLYT